MPSAASWILAIDFGTSNSAAAHSGATSGGVETLSLTHTSNLMPSAVFLETPERVIVGYAAIDAAQHNPAGYVASPKRLIGGQSVTTVNGHTVPTATLVSAVLRTIIGRAVAAHAGHPPSQVVLTHPEAWAPEQIAVLTDAAAGAGVPADDIRTISEPRAAAAHYSRSHAMAPGATIVVFDFGGGTLDIAVLTVTGDSDFEVVAARGNNGLGGKNLDALIQRWVFDRIAERDPDLVEWLRRGAPIDTLQALQDSIRHAKELLSETPSATITVPAPNGARTTLQLTRDEFDELITPAVTEAIRLTRETLLDAAITHPDQITALYLTGGSSRIPRIQHELGALGPVATLDDPKTVVAQGAVTTALVRATPNTDHQRVPGPEALMPAWYGQLGHPPGRGQPTGRPIAGPQFQEDPTPPRRRTGRTAAIVVSAVVVLGIIAAAIVVTRTGSDDPAGPDSTAAAGAAESTAAAAATGNDGGSIVTDEATLLATLPGSLQADTTNCRKTGFTTNGAVTMMCDFAEGGSLVELMEPPGDYMMFHIDSNEADTRIVNIRNGVYTDGTGILIESPDRQAAGEVDTDGAGTTIDYVDAGTGLVITVDGLASVEDAQTFLSQSGLIR
ncbi:Hsp70 family protein [Gordonia sp. HNM0687]|uniref:Hsp70 family protein n=1 Tax=Gordonia mangrovi TaxID=2665643 RepID=A0A6L7GQC2_9ACTN|nr:Hsp70 family protein [Gordonia mangrovi]MXP21411.1 Hsp70 family protein [Gordonia mangrovi]UVF80160.1 Hsp70 family protein [Gordonia mangrovi]